MPYLGLIEHMVTVLLPGGVLSIQLTDDTCLMRASLAATAFEMTFDLADYA
jgi:hypothetical protein